MFLGDILIANGFVTPQDIAAALERQQKSGGALGDNLVALGRLTQAKLEQALELAPAEPRELKDTGLGEQFLVNLMLKTMYVRALESPSQLGESLKLPLNVIAPLLQFAKDNALVHVLGSSGGRLTSELRYDLTDQGRRRAIEQFEQSRYLGPAPVPMQAYIAQIERQHITNERVSRADLAAQLAHLVLPERLLDELGPAANSAKAILLYGPPGSGKTSVAEAMGRSFKGLVYIPYAVELDGQVITIFDPTLHNPVEKAREAGTEAGAGRSLIREAVDARWALCTRPCVMAGGELRLEMLELKYSAEAGLYEAPLQLKAMNGIFIIDDFGRQMVNPRDLLNRWIVPLEKHFDFLHLHTGRKFLLPFDVLIVFSTNLAPEDLMDEAFLRRIPYKILVGQPAASEYVEIFRRVCAAAKLEVPKGMVDELLREYYKARGEDLASYHPRFLIDRVVDQGRYHGELPHLDRDRLAAAWRNLFVERKSAPAAPTRH
ncbi:MAG: AAA family ATPase [Betaproteobacteria bacterium]|nr:MAG: AAA family ATPase [Betaproteobacteria bacterium]